ncbi:MAG TPA: dihydrodipicolinate synthase family protein [Bryobacteraceae bacterium]|nr:dihydrodipicolinate synthase family protein [Bryobacteraceae bacterium]
MHLTLPRADGRLERYTLAQSDPLPDAAGPVFSSRVAYAAAHVVIDPVASRDPFECAVIDWESTIAFRRHLWSLGFGVAEAMDTAQRGMGLDWPRAAELIQRSCAAASGPIACGVNTDSLDPAAPLTIDSVIAAYEQQCEFVEKAGGRVILMASRALARCAQSPADYVRVYGHLLPQLKQPAILHWLGDAFDPALAGYWGGSNVAESMASCLDIIRENAASIDGVKISLLDANLEIQMRRRLPESVRMYTGDDFNYPELIHGDDQGHSDALLGIFDAIAPVAALALRALDSGETGRYNSLLDPTLPLSRHIFQRPTFYYKTGVVFLAYLNGHQRHFRMLGGQESARSLGHLGELFVLADQARLFRNPELAVERMQRILSIGGIE